MSFCLIFTIGYLGYIIAKFLRLPAPAMLGSLIAVTLLSLFFNIDQLPSLIKIFTQGISGAFIGAQIKKEDIASFKSLYKPLFLLLLLFTLNTFITGFIIHSISNLDILTALLCCVPGGITDISLLSIDLGANSTIVAIMHLVRLVFVLIVFPFVIRCIHKNTQSISTKTEITISKEYSFTKKIIITILIAMISSFIGYSTSIPAGSLIFSMMIVAFFNINTQLISMSKNLKTIAQICAGALVGSSANPTVFAELNYLILPILVMLISYVILNILFTLICTKLGWLDQKSAMFTSCPAGASDMALIATDLGGDLKKIAIIQAIRLMFAISVIPQLILLII